MMDSRTQALYGSVTNDARRQTQRDLDSNAANSISRKPVANETASSAPQPQTSRTMPGGFPSESVENGPLVDGSQPYDMHNMATALPEVPHVDLGASLNPALAHVGSTGPTGPTVPERSSSKWNDQTHKAQNLARDLQQHSQRMSEERDSAPNFSRGQVKKTGLDKPLPNAPSTASTRDAYGADRIIDAGTTADTSVHETIAPAVVHETIRTDVHEIEHQVTTRDIHQDHIYHRVLPIHDVEVLPPVHYVADGQSVRQVSEDQIPGRAHNGVQQQIANVFKQAIPRDSSGPGMRKFSAREFPGNEGDYREMVTSDGTKLSERYWVHPPKLEEVGMMSGQTKPFHFK